MVAFEELPEECIATILSHTTPVDVGRLSVVSNTFRSAASSDAGGNYFLPSDDSQFVDYIISHSHTLANGPTKKALFLALFRQPIIMFDNGKKSFELDRKSGKICYMLNARSLTIDCGVTGVPGNENWLSTFKSMYPKIVQLIFVSRLEIRGMINTLSLSPNTHYAAFLMYKLGSTSCGFENEPMELSVGVEGRHCITKSVSLHPNVKVHSFECSHGPMVTITCKCRFVLRQLNKLCIRSDGWLEIEMGKFFNSSLQDKQVQMSVLQKNSTDEVMSDFILKGIDVRPIY